MNPLVRALALSHEPQAEVDALGHRLQVLHIDGISDEGLLQLLPPPFVHIVAASKAHFDVIWLTIGGLASRKDDLF